MNRVAVISKDNAPMMPTKCSRARRWIKEGRAIGKWSKLGVFYVQMTTDAQPVNMQNIAIGVDPGKQFTGIAVQSTQFTLLLIHLVLPFKSVTKMLGLLVDS